MPEQLNPAPRSARRLLTLAVPAVLLLAIVIAVIIWWSGRSDGPEQVSLSDAVAQVTTIPGSSGDASGEGATDGGSPPEGVEGVWVVDTDLEEFDYATSAGSFVGYRVNEELVGLGAITAVGRTPVVEGRLVIAGTTATEVEIIARFSGLRSDDSRRDGRVSSALGVSQFPTARFVLTEPIDLGDAADSGEAVQVDAVGELTVRDITQPVTFTLEAQLAGEVIVIVGSTVVEFADYGVQVPSAPIVLSAEDVGEIEVKLLLRRD